jgi:AraC family transcriptional regulator, positive regulator of tynA and feaB
MARSAPATANPTGGNCHFSPVDGPFPDFRWAPMPRNSLVPNWPVEQSPMREAMYKSEGALNCNSEFVAECDLARLIAEGLAPKAELSYYSIRSHRMISVCRFRGPAIHVKGGGDGASVVVLHLLYGGCWVKQDGRQAYLRKGDFTLVCTARPLEILEESECELILISAPIDSMGVGVADLPITAVRGRSDEELGRIVAGYIQTIAHLASTTPLHLFGDLCRSALSVALIGAADTSKDNRPVGQTRKATLEKVKSYVGSRLNRKLTPRLVAAELGISIRYLHLIFKEEKATFSAWLWDQRLLACKSRLCDSKYERETVGAIALECGFLNFSHFSRRFRERFGISAKDLRRASMRNLAKSSAPNTARISPRRIERLAR